MILTLLLIVAALAVFAAWPRLSLLLAGSILLFLIIGTIVT